MEEHSSCDKSSHSKPSQPEVILYTDGACSGNPGPGGWAYILTHVPTGKTIEGYGAEPVTTNNKMELRAVIEGLKRLKRPTRVHVVTDSSYVKQGITEWIHKWKKNNWRLGRTSMSAPVKNVELWMELDSLRNRHQTTFELVRGHAGHPQNERCDQLAVQACEDLIKENSRS